MRKRSTSSSSSIWRAGETVDNVRLTPDTLIFDIETSYGVYAVWHPGKVYVSPESMLREAKIICIGYKWAGKKRTYCLKWDEEQNDRDMMLEFVKVMDSADRVVGHNSDRFDIRWIRARCLKHRIPMMPNYTSIDTLKSCRTLFKMHSNKLAEVAKFLRVGAKMETGGLSLWMDVIERRCPIALKKMMRYCMNDVRLTEKVLEVLNPYMPVRSRVNGCITLCPECGSNRLSVNQRRKYTALGTERVSLKCLECGKYLPAIAASRWDAAVAS